MKKAAKSTKKVVDDPAEVAASIYRESLLAIREEIRGIIDGAIKPKKHDATSRIAWLAKQASQVAAEQRKAEKAEMDALKRLSPIAVIAWCRQQTVETRGRIVREVAAIDERGGRSVLG
jgi:hypothetical protein